MRPNDWWVGRIQGIMDTASSGEHRLMLLQRTVGELKAEVRDALQEQMCEHCICRMEHKEGCQCSRDIE